MNLFLLEREFWVEIEGFEEIIVSDTDSKSFLGDWLKMKSFIDGQTSLDTVKDSYEIFSRLYLGKLLHCVKVSKFSRFIFFFSLIHTLLNTLKL